MLIRSTDIAFADNGIGVCFSADIPPQKLIKGINV